MGLFAVACGQGSDGDDLDVGETRGEIITDHIGYWKFDETSGTTAYDSYTSSPDNGTLYNGTTANTQGPVWTSAGKVDGAITFDGANDNVQITDSGYGPAFTLAFWFKVNENDGTHGTFFGHGTAYAANSLMIRVSGSSGSIWTYLCDSADTSCSTGYGASGNWADGSWHHYALTVSSTQDTAKVYIDGTLKVNVPRGGSTINPSGNIYVGRRGDGQYPLNGSMDELRIFNRELSATEVAELIAYTTQTTAPTDYIGYWKMDEGTGTTTYDSYPATPDNGTFYNGSTANTQGPSWVTGKLGGGIGFDGSDDSVRITDSGYGAAFSLAFWFKVSDNTGGHKTFFAHGTQFSQNAVMMRMAGSGDGSLWTYVCDSADTSCGTGYGTSNPSGGNWADGNWHHYVLTVSSTQDSAKVYVDGTLRTNIPRGGSSINPSGDMYVGRGSDGGSPFKGSLDELRLYNRELSSTEVTNLYNYTPVDGISPTVDVTAPLADATVSGTITLSATANDNVGVVGVTFLVDGAALSPEDTSSPYSYASYNTTALSDGAHTISARARDAAGNTRTDTITVSVNNGQNPPPMTTINYSDSSTDFLNPERGWYKSHIDIADGTAPIIRTAQSSSDEPATVALAIIHLRDEFTEEGADVDTDTTVPQGLLDDLELGLQDVRSKGYKVIIRFKYQNDGDFCTEEDPPTKALVQAHINGFAPLFQEYRDVILLIQAGYLGVWGEFNQECPAPLIANGDWKDIILTAVNALPDGRMLAMRTPDLKDEFITWRGITTNTQGFADSLAFTSDIRAKIGHFNDCYLSSSTDYGTYESPVTTWQNYVFQESKWTPFGGETCTAASGHRLSCQSGGLAPAEMSSTHVSYINMGHTDSVTNPSTGIWATGGCWSDVSKRMGYRFELDQVKHSTSVKPGERLELTFTIQNKGFASMFNRRPVFVVLRNSAGTSKWAAEITDDTVDPRRWLPGGQLTFTRTITIPSTVPAASNYTLALWLPDDAEVLQDDSRYSVRFATSSVWEDTTGYNLLTSTFTVSTSAASNPGEAHATFAACTECP